MHLLCCRHQLCSIWYVCIIASVCACVCVFVCVCTGTRVGVWSRHLNMGRSSSIQPRQVSHHSHQHHKNISPYGAFSPLQEIIFSTDKKTVSMLSVSSQLKAGAGSLLVTAASLHLCAVHVCMCGVITSLFWPGLPSVLCLGDESAISRTFPICSLSWEA